MANVRRALLLHLGLVLGVVISALTSSTSAEVIYQIWPRSFQDSNADGSGDIQGVINHLDHFVDLGIDTIWLNSIYTSPLANSGNDISNFTDVNSLYGTLDDFDALIVAAHDQGLKVIIDFIPNHSSDEHPWFNASIYSVGNYTDYYIWANGTVNANGTISVPNNWESSLNSAGEGSAWEWNSIRQQYYLHQYSVNEPDLNLRHDAVIQELLDVLDFWLNRGVDGFYINGVSYFLEDINFTDNPTGSTIYSYGLTENVDLLYRFRAYIDQWVQQNDRNQSKLLFAEGFESQENLLNYYGNNNYSGIPAINVDFMSTFSSTSNASYIASVLDSWLSLIPNNESANWKLSNQDYSRISTRYGLNRADGLNMLALSLPGNTFTYYGEEIAMLDNEDITYAETVDPIALAAGETDYASVSRDPYRTPMQWDTTNNAGFTTTASAYLPVNSNYATRNVWTQTEADSSNYYTYKATVALRSKPAFTNGSYELVSLNNDRVLVLRRYLEGYPTYILAINLGLARRTVNLTEAFSDLPSNLYIRVLSNSAVFSESTVATDEFVLTANAAVILSDEEERTDDTDTGNVTTKLDWHQAATIYQIYTKSFQDSDGNGVGDIRGIISRLSYISETGWTGFSLTPFYPSPQRDGGYDITNFVGVDPLFGSLADFQELVRSAHEKNLKIILDFVPNHSSDQHSWFQNSVARIEPYTNYYVWSDGVTSNTTNVIQPPNNWLSVFGGSAWTWNAQRQQYYLHQFHTSQPDLNLRNPAVIAELTAVLQFWLDQGVDGFRISASAHLFENANLPNEPVNENAGPNVLETDHEYLNHIHTTDQNENFNLVYHWRSVVDEYVRQTGSDTKILITDSRANRDVVVRYFGNTAEPGAHVSLNYGLIANLSVASNAAEFAGETQQWLSLLLKNQTSSSILGNHDHSRVASRFALNRVDGLNMLVLLPGTAFTYMGEELGLLDASISYADTQDPLGLNAGPNRYQLFSRDPARTPFHWDGSTSAGFSTNASTWLPVASNYLFRNLALQSNVDRSMYQTYKKLLEIKKTETIKRGSISFESLNNGQVLAFLRQLDGYESYVVLINLGIARHVVDIARFTQLMRQPVKICLASANAVIPTENEIHTNEIVLTANAAVVLCDEDTDAVSTTSAPIVTSPTETVTSPTPIEPTTDPTVVDAPILGNNEITGILEWWQTASVYQIYPKSFQDSNGDGIGDIPGIISRLDHLKETGVDAIWFNSMLRSPQIDGGFDVSDNHAIDIIFGNQALFQQLIAEAHSRGIKVIFDFVPNHSSDQNLWFRLSVERAEPFTDFYVWHDGIPSANGTSPPNNWLSVFGGSAWTWNEQRQQYYLHQFHSSQPDYNYRNPTVINEMTNALRFWLGQGVDGFRLSAVAHLFENENLLNEPVNDNAGSNILDTDHAHLNHIHTSDQPETFDMVYQWRAIIDNWTQQAGGDPRILITDSHASQHISSRYFGNGTHLGAHVALNFGVLSNLTQASRASDYVENAVEWFENLPHNQSSNWILGTHDHGRTASRFLSNLVDGLNMFHLLPGTSFTYMGEELGLMNTAISFADTQDPHAINAGPDRFELFTRDPARTPYHWNNSTSAGFSTNPTTWLPVHSNYVTRNLAAQMAVERSNYQTYKAILKLRQTETIKRGATRFLALNNNNVVAFSRELDGNDVYVVLINLGLPTISVNISAFAGLPSQGLRVCVASANAIITPGTAVNTTSIPLSANAAVVLCNSELPDATTTVPTPSPDATTPTETTTVTPATTTTAQTTTTVGTTPTTPTPSDEPILVNSAILGELSWWQTASVYQIYPKSFQDSNGDGIGDIPGIISRLDHLKETGVDAIWFNSMLRSPQIDGGFDVSDNHAIDIIFGNQALFQQLIAEAHSRGIKVIFDFVPNHSSDQNLWFRLSVERAEPFTDFYVWHDGIPTANGTSPPNNWLSVFGGSAWTWNEQRQQYYLHQFHSSQPDYNYRNPTVVNEMTNALRFWLGQGVDGFRLSAVAHLFENENLLDEPVNDNAGSNVLDTDHAHLNHIHTSDQPETFDMVYQWRAIIDNWTQQAGGDPRILITDSHASQHVSSRYFGNGTHLGAHVALNFGVLSNLTQASRASDYVENAVQWSENLPQNQSSNWILGTHDHGRTASRFLSNLVDGLNMFHLLPGTSFTYMGEELGLMNTAISFADTQDPHAINAGPDRFELFTRDPARTPYHWNSSTSAGFSTNPTTWLPVHSNYVTRNLAAQMAVERSNYQTYKAILKLRQTETIKRGATRFLALNNNNVVAFSRELDGNDVYVVLINLGLPTISVNISAFAGLPSAGLRVCVASSNAIITPGTAVNTTSIPLSANAAVVLCNSELPDATTTVPTPSPDATTPTETTTVTPATTTTAQTTTTVGTTPTTPTPSDEPILVNSAILGELSWWQTASVYQIYPKSFQDSNGDGIGDIPGIISRLDHLKETGVDAIWFNSMLRSPQIDGGFDVSDNHAIDIIFGNQALFQQLIAEAHSRGIKVIFDFVPNHSSDQNLWFRLSVERAEPFTDFYVWHDGIPTANGTSPPNNWLSVFGGSAWTWNEQRQQYYLHQFHSSQPDYNYRNPTVINEITNSLRFWLGQGVDGFRLSAAAHLFENENLLDEPVNDNAGSNVLDTDHAHLNHIHTSDQPETFDMVYQWRAIIDDWTQQAGGDPRILITDSRASQHVSSRYFGNGTHLGAHVALNFGVLSNLTQASRASDYVENAVQWSENLPQNQSSNWILGTHDHGRTASRFLSNLVDGLNMFHLLPGTSFTYMGEELGLMNTAISFADTQDPHAINAGPDRFELFTRDPARTPYHWNNSTSAGFSTNPMTWLPVHSNYVTRNLAAQMAVERSNYQTYKAILKLRQTETIKRGATRFLALNNNNVVAFSRELDGNDVYVVLINLGLPTISVNISAFAGLPSQGLRVCVASANAIITPGTAVNTTSIPLSANAAVVLCNSELPDATTTVPSPSPDATTPTETTTVTPAATTTAQTTTTVGTTPTTPTPSDEPILVNSAILGELSWWQTASVYQIYPKSFQDSNGDGIGDIPGIISRLDHLKETGVDAIWFNSMLRSPQIDGGFDVSDNRAIDIIFGNQALFQQLIAEAHSRGIKVIFDFVPNHSSDQNLWFRLSVERAEPFTDFYVWHDGIPTANGTSPPNNWLSVFGGSAWTWNEQRQQYYLHQFHRSQPDYNYRNPTVINEMTNSLRFWLGQGVDGFRLSAVAHLFENEDLLDEPVNENAGPNVLDTDHAHLNHIHTSDQHETFDMVYQWRAIIDDWTQQAGGDPRILITDSHASQHVSSRYFGNGTHLGAHVALNFGVISNLTQASRASDYVNNAVEWFDNLPHDQSSNWILGTHDHGRTASRFLLNLVDILNLFHLLPGTSFTYMGEELGLMNTAISFADTQDPHAINAGPDRFELFTRDPARTPYHWNSSISAGFSTNPTTWLPVNSNYVTRNLAAQMAVERSNYQTYKAILKLRKTETIKRGATRFLALNNDNVVAFSRELEGDDVYVVLINLGLPTVSVNISLFAGLPSEGLRVCVASTNAIIAPGTVVDITSISLSANAAVVLCDSEIPETTTSTPTTTPTTTTTTTPPDVGTTTTTTPPVIGTTTTTTPPDVGTTTTTSSPDIGTTTTTTPPDVGTTTTTTPPDIGTTTTPPDISTTTTSTTPDHESQTEDSAEGADGGATTMYLSSVLLVISLWSIVF